MQSTNDHVDAELTFGRALHLWLEAALQGDQVGDLGTHLSDIRFSAGEIDKSIAALLAVNPTDAVVVRRALLSVHTQLYRHLTLHLEHLREPLRDAIDGLFDEDTSAADRKA